MIWGALAEHWAIFFVVFISILGRCNFGQFMKQMDPAARQLHVWVVYTKVSYLIEYGSCIKFCVLHLLAAYIYLLCLLAVQLPEIFFHTSGILPQLSTHHCLIAPLINHTFSSRHGQYRPPETYQDSGRSRQKTWSSRTLENSCTILCFPGKKHTS